ncbi:hypothetical protein [Granulosicoccus antarcticus]|uniref:hypothetical protein n=1 Tax=Granulosicoccus antarcticus TaxID=437505 RepID=UPI0012FE124B|nr:hypothetical protein [Granulosicoccus antarcticus]
MQPFSDQAMGHLVVLKRMDSLRSNEVALSRSANRVSTLDDAIHLHCHGPVRFDVGVRTARIFMGGRSVLENAHSRHTGQESQTSG